MPYGSRSWAKEKLPIALEAHLKAQSSEISVIFQAKIKRAVLFSSLVNPARTAYLSFRDQELSNAVWLVELWRGKVAVHTFFGWSQAGVLRRPSRRNYRKP